ncbi:hypothetical protein KS4_29370 [Poriferisphaera corsica]|uniref:Uncharacterized protein n=1 Tax=Poriferisphaera corsica TaxID=2528020 RepID=A0A517YXB6_9BACT|nr:hypothetical protein [Poriferisphaera corsica]QDU34861.1 hypothetical protein KS4_29370 [Poriferisphaera corsica]
MSVEQEETDCLKVRVGRWWGRMVLLCIAIGAGFGLWARWIYISDGELVVAWLVVSAMLVISAVYQQIEIDRVNREVRWKWLLFGLLVLWTKKMGFECVDGVKLIDDGFGKGADRTERWAVAVMLNGRYVEVQRFEEGEAGNWEEVREKANKMAIGLSDMMRVPLTYGVSAMEQGGVDDEYDDDEGAWL